MKVVTSRVPPVTVALPLRVMVLAPARVPEDQVKLIQTPLQDATSEVLTSLQSGDVFFIDRQILLTFNLGGLVTAQQGFVLPAGGQ